MHKWHKGSFKHEGVNEGPVPIISDAVVAADGIGDGKFIPVILLDTTQRPDIDDLVRFHEYTPSGDVWCTWGSNKAHKYSRKPIDFTKFALFLEFERPSKTFVNIEFDVKQQGILVESILLSGAFYLQPAKILERFIDDMDKPKILVEVPETGFRDFWDSQWRKIIVKEFKRDGLNRSDAINAAKKTIKQAKERLSLRTTDFDGKEEL